MARSRATSPYIIARLIARWMRNWGWPRWLAAGLGLAAIVAGVMTYAKVTGSFGVEFDPDAGRKLLVLDLALLLALGAMIGVFVAQLWSARQRGAAGSRLHVRLVLLFGVVSVTPAIVVAVAAFLFINVQATFSEPVRRALEQSLEVAEAYLSEHQQTIAADALAMAADLNRNALRLQVNTPLLAQVLRAQAGLRAVTEALVVDASGQILAQVGLGSATLFHEVPPEAMEKARSGEVVVLGGSNDDRVRAIVRLEGFIDAYLFIGRFVDTKVLNHIERTRKAVASYQRLKGVWAGLEPTFAAVFAVVALLMLLVAIIVGLFMANRLVAPLSDLIDAAERVGSGDLAARVPWRRSADEIGTLSRTFNTMTQRLRNQQTELLAANQQLDRRRHFTEAVLAGVSAGVIGLDTEGRINLPNRVASQLLAIELDQMQGKKLARAVPEFASLLRLARLRARGMLERQVQIKRKGRMHTLLVRVAIEPADETGAKGYIVTFDDITELLSAQRKAAWADVARRIAHEIKNPLTPIQLSAERLKRKYLREVTSDPETFTACTDTIVRHVGDIGRMVDEFSAFARMPAPSMKPENLSALAREAVVLQRAAHPGIGFELDLPQGDIYLPCDARQMRQALTNLLQNALDAIDSREPVNGAEPPPGQVGLQLALQDGRTVITVEDNGIGLPPEGQERLTEPYVTTKAKGTGLGLAIVKKIMEDHDGDLSLEDRDGGGARVILTFHGRGAATAADDAVPTPANDETPRKAVHGA